MEQALGIPFVSQTKNVVVRLRIVFLAVIGFLMIVGLLGLQMIAEVDRAKSQLAVAVPILGKTLQTEQRTTELLLLLTRIRSAQSEAELSRLAAELRMRFDSIKYDEDVLETPGGAPLGAGDRDIEARIGALDTGAKKILDLRRELLRQATLEQEKFVEMVRQRNAIGLLLSELAISFAGDPDPTVGRLSGNDTMARVFLANSAAQLTVEIDTMFVLADQFAFAKTPTEAQQLRSVLHLRLRRAVQTLTQMPAVPERQRLAGAIQKARNMLVGTGGLADITHAKLTALRTLENESENQTRIFSAVDDALERLVELARDEVAKATTGLSQVTRRRAFIQICAFSGAILLVGIAGGSIVERQISQRMARLTDAVLDIAAGNTEREVGVRGKDEIGRMAGALEVFKDNARELRRSNSELEKFAYAAAHDLRSPLKAISDLVVWTNEDPDNRLSEDSREYLALIGSRTERLRQLLADILEYSRVGKEGGDLEVMDLPRAVGELAGLLDPKGRFDIRYQSGDGATEVKTYATPLTQILINLIGNAIKHHDRQSGRITVASRAEGGRLIVTVTDDGPGIPAEYRERVFGLFQTLKPRDQTEGSGLGLAMTGKIVEFYTGSIRIDDPPGQARGCQLIFDFPLHPVGSPTLSEAA